VEEEAGRIFCLSSENVLAQKIRGVPGRAREVVHEILGVRAVTQRERCQIQRGWPALCTLDQPRYLIVRQRYAGGFEQRACFVVFKRKRRCPHLDKAPVS
jgi:hypothetical protein